MVYEARIQIRQTVKNELYLGEPLSPSRWKQNILTFGQKSMLEPSPSEQIKFNQMTCLRAH